MLRGKNIQSICTEIGESACLAFCYCFAAERLKSTFNYDSIAGKATLFRDFLEAANLGYIGEGCWVLNAEQIMNLVNNQHTFIVTKNDNLNGSLDAIEDKLAAVRYSYTDAKGGFHNHWILMNNGKVIFDSLDSSNSVKLGKPDQARIITVR